MGRAALGIAGIALTTVDTCLKLGGQMSRLRNKKVEAKRGNAAKLERRFVPRLSLGSGDVATLAELAGYASN